LWAGYAGQPVESNQVLSAVGVIRAVPGSAKRDARRRLSL
jgi:hypothetical protein